MHVRIQNEHCHSLKLTNVKTKLFTKIFTMLIFDVSHMTEKIWRCSIFQADHAISFKNMITR